ncbi:MAG: hypothetical protein HYW01_06995 [Deltaproteobacteria bacterium]|nr:hypothetical protein [Deltaproteobacteria bacterium]
MWTVDVVGRIAFFITVTYTCVGLPIQVRRNYINKSTTGISLFMIVVLCFTFSSWIAYGLVKSPQDWFIIGSNVPGAGWVFVILCQFWIYRSKRNTF